MAASITRDGQCLGVKPLAFTSHAARPERSTSASKGGREQWVQGPTVTSRHVPFKCGSCLIDSCHRCEAQSGNSNTLSITGAGLSEGVKCAGGGAREPRVRRTTTGCPGP
ncbi:hypothetical protein MUK42_14738 [Musa troglodytarum]|uniref:Uncharacterized protein n=1 Tax=Musa troglodytarum TaxID=320322 RepID=A0A9E7IAW4_9LILI|nr:hypothetical protein MUK42_14738 [Musa troglodytarum]